MKLWAAVYQVEASTYECISIRLWNSTDRWPLWDCNQEAITQGYLDSISFLLNLMTLGCNGSML